MSLPLRKRPSASIFFAIAACTSSGELHEFPLTRSQIRRFHVFEYFLYAFYSRIGKVFFDKFQKIIRVSSPTNLQKCVVLLYLKPDNFREFIKEIKYLWYFRVRCVVFLRNANAPSHCFTRCRVFGIFNVRLMRTWMNMRSVWINTLNTWCSTPLATVSRSTADKTSLWKPIYSMQFGRATMVHVVINISLKERKRVGEINTD